MASSEESLYLPDDCWILIFKLVTDGCDDREYSRYLNSLSCISKQLLSITNNFQFSLTIYTATLPYSCLLFQRFPNLTSLNLSRCYTIDIPSFQFELHTLLLKISHLPLKLTSLNISNKSIIPARGLQALSQNITTLTSLTCSNIFSFTSTDMFLIANCFPLLEELDLSQSGRLTNIVGGVEALSSALLKLRRVNLSGHEYINDELLFHLFKNCKLLEDVIVFRCPQLTLAGMSSALIERPTLRSLSFTRYYEVYEHAVLFELIRNCPSLNAIKVEYQCGRVQIVRNPNRVNFVLNPQLKSLSLVSNRWLTNENMEAFASSLPNLELLDLSSSHNMYEEGVCQVLRRCCKIRHLNLSYCPRVKLRNMNFEVLELEVLNLSHTRVDDKGLRVISKSCCGLLQLLLESCFEVTEKGLKHVVENCKQLREINLKNCRGVQGDIVASMVSSRPSLRKIIAPPCYSFTDKKWEYFSLCMIIA